MGLIIDSYHDSNAVITFQLYNGANTKLSQSFKGTGTAIKKLFFSLSKYGSPTGNVYVEIYAHTGTYGTSGKPDGAALATSGNVDISTLTTSMSTVEFTFSSPYTLTSGTAYCAVINYSGGDSSNKLYIHSDSTSPYHEGNVAYASSSTYTTSNLYDIVFIAEDDEDSSFDDYYEKCNYAATGTLRSGAYTAMGQSFASAGGTLKNAQFYLKKTGSPTGSVYAKLYAHSGTFGTDSVPTGSPLATSDAVNISTLTTSLALITFTFSGANQYSLSASTNYVIVVEYSGGDSSNNLNPAFDNSSPYHGGNYCYLSSGNWYANASYDTIFYVYTATSSGTTPISATDTGSGSDTISVVNKFTLTDSGEGLDDDDKSEFHQKTISDVNVQNITTF